MNRQVINAIMEYLKENSSQLNYKYVLGTSFGGNILYANDSLDITRNIIKGLNEKYQQTKKNANKLRMGFADHYFSKQKGFSPFFTGPPSGQLRFIVVIPAFRNRI